MNASPSTDRAGSTSDVVLDLAGLQSLLDVLHDRGFMVIGPTVRDGAIVNAPITSVGDLPRGWGDAQEPGSYRIRRRDDDLLFGFAAGPQSWKAELFPARVPLWSADLTGEGMTVQVPDPWPPAYAFLGVRACDLRAITIQDAILAERVPDADYVRRREPAFVVALTCSDPAATCFCVSMGSGPVPGPGFDLALTELLDDDGHRFVVRAGTDRGAEVLDAVPATAAAPGDTDAAREVGEVAASRMVRSMETDGLRDLLYRNVEHPRWDDVADRCLSCTNCTMVCPTCFCTSVEEVGDLRGDHVEQHRVWESCFTAEHSHLPGGSVRPTTRSRYRQWMTHKLASWQDQFGMSGCVGCGRCIAWCPVGIDITEEAAVIRATDGVPEGAAP